MAGIGAAGSFMGLVSESSSAPSVWRQLAFLVVSGAIGMTGLGLLRGSRRLHLVAAILMIGGAVGSGIWLGWEFSKVHTSKTDGAGYVALGALFWIPALVVGAVLLLREYRRDLARMSHS